MEPHCFKLFLNHIMLEFKCRLQDKGDIDAQLASLKLGILYSMVSPVLQNKAPQTGQIIAYKAKLKNSDERQWQTYTVHEYKGRWSATIIENTLGAFDNECIFEDFIINGDAVNLNEIIILE